MPRLPGSDARDRSSVCQNCGGTGEVLDNSTTPPSTKKCSVCGGSGRTTSSSKPGLTVPKPAEPLEPVEEKPTDEADGDDPVAEKLNDIEKKTQEYITKAKRDGDEEEESRLKDLLEDVSAIRGARGMRGRRGAMNRARNNASRYAGASNKSGGEDPFDVLLGLFSEIVGMGK